MDHLVCLGLRGISDHDRDTEGPSLVEIAVLLVPLDHHHPLPLSNQTTDDRDPDRSESDDDHVIGHPRHLAATK